MTLSSRWTSLLPRERLVVSMAAGAIALAVVGTRLAPAWNQWAATAGVRFQTLTDSLVRIQAVASEQGQRRDSVQLLQFDGALSHATVVAARGEEAAAMVVLNLVAAAADDVGVSLTSLQRLQDVAKPIRAASTRRPTFMTFSVKATGLAAPDLLPELLAFIDTSRVQLVTRSISVSASTPVAGGRAKDVRFDLVVAAIIQLRSPVRLPRR